MTGLQPPEEMLTAGNDFVALLQNLVKCDAVALTAWDPFRQADSHLLLASHGYAGEVLSDILMSHRGLNPAYSVLRAHAPLSLRWKDAARDWNIDFSQTPIATRHLLPAGFNEGISAFLCLPDHRQVGAIHMSWTKPSLATDERREIVDRFHPVLARAANLLHSYEIIAAQMSPEENVVVLTAGEPQRIPGREVGPVLGRPGVLQGIDLVAGRVGLKRYLFVGDDGQTHRLQLISCADDRILVTERPIASPFRLTPRELEVVSLLVEGASNVSIAEALYLSPRTVGTHIENILAKMGCSSRTQAAAAAIEDGVRLLPAAVAP